MYPYQGAVWRFILSVFYVFNNRTLDSYTSVYDREIMDVLWQACIQEVSMAKYSKGSVTSDEIMPFIRKVVERGFMGNATQSVKLANVRDLDKLQAELKKEMVKQGVDEDIVITGYFRLNGHELIKFKRTVDGVEVYDTVETHKPGLAPRPYKHLIYEWAQDLRSRMENRREEQRTA